MNKVIFVFLVLILAISPATAVIIKSVYVDQISPGGEGSIQIEVENILNTDAEEVSISLHFADTPFIPIGKSQETIDEIEDGDEEDFVFRIRAGNNIAPGNYEIPYTLEYEDDGDEKTRTGTIGVQVKAESQLSFTATVDDPIVGQQGRINLRIVNRGFADARFVSIRVLPEDFTLISGPEVYIGEVESDDFETQNFDVFFTDTNPTFRAIITYKDFENNDVIREIEIPLTVYSRERALELGIIQQSYVGIYIAIAILLIILIIVWRTIKKRRRLKKSMKRE